MGIDLGALIAAGSTAAGGIAQGLQERRALERQALHDRLADELLKAQTEYYGRRGQPGAKGSRAQKLVDPVTGQVYSWDPDTNEMTAATMAPTPGTVPGSQGTPGHPVPGLVPTVPGQAPIVPPAPKVPAKLGVKPERPVIGTTAEGASIAINPRTLEVTPIAGAGKPVTATERKTAAQAEVAQSDHEVLTKLETDSNTMQEVARYMAIPAVGKLIPGSVGGAVSDLLRYARSASLSDAALEYLKRLYDYASLVGPDRYGRRFGSEIMMQQIWGEYGGGQFGIGAGGMRATQKNRLNGVQALRAQGGSRAAAQVKQYFPPDTSTAAPQTGGINSRFDPRKKP